MKKNSSTRICCVPGCQSKERINTELTFYSFPARGWWEMERRRNWINSVRREPVDGIPWAPNSRTRICSLHFLGGQRSENPEKESFNPTIFPWKKENPLALDRENRLEKRKQKRQVQLLEKKRKSEEMNLVAGLNNKNEVTENLLQSSPEKGVKKCHIEVQTDYFPDTSDEQSKMIGFCWQDYGKNEASTQCDIRVPTAKSFKNIHVNTEHVEPVFCGYSSIKDDAAMKQLAGVTLSFFTILLQCISAEKDYRPKFYRKLNTENRLLLFLMKMKLGLNFSAISCLFNVSRTTAATIFFSVLEVVFKRTKTWIFWPSLEAIRKTMPRCFQNYPNCRAIIDCTELRCDTPPTVEQRALMYSTYKSGFTVKFLVAITPSGYISFISNGFGGRTSDGIIVNSSSFIKLIQPGDEIMADKGFPQIKSELLKRKITLIMPPFAFNPQFTREEVLEGYSIASVRIHVERAIQRIKIFKILEHISIDLLPHIDKIMYVAGVLANNKEPLIRDHHEAKK